MVPTHLESQGNGNWLGKVREFSKNYQTVKEKPGETELIEINKKEIENNGRIIVKSYIHMMALIGLPRLNGSSLIFPWPCF